MSSLISGLGPNISPNNPKDTTPAQSEKGVSQGKGVILAKDSIDVPFEKQVSIQSQGAEAGHPSLPPLFQGRLAKDNEEDLSRSYYRLLRNALPPLLKLKLKEDEEQIYLEERDPDLVALDTSLKFEANLLALSDKAARNEKGEKDADPSVRLFMAFRAALQGFESTKSQTGFIGPILKRCQKGIAHFIRLSLAPQEKKDASLLLAFTQVVAIVAFFLAIYLKEYGKQLFDQPSPIELLQELGLNFLLGSNAFESALHAVCQELELSPQSEERVSAIGMTFLSSLLILTDVNQNEEFFGRIKNVIQPKLACILQVLQLQSNEKWIQVLQQVLNSSDVKTFKKELTTFCEIVGLDFNELEQEIKHLENFFKQLFHSFKNINDQTRVTVTTLTSI